MRTITIREQYLTKGVVTERTATHIMTDVRGLETLCEISFDKLHILNRCNSPALWVNSLK